MVTLIEFTHLLIPVLGVVEPRTYPVHHDYHLVFGLTFLRIGYTAPSTHLINHPMEFIVWHYLYLQNEVRKEVCVLGIP